MANTTNLNLEKPLGTDQALVSVINSNSDKIDNWAGSTNQALSNVTTAKNMNVSSLADFQSQLETLVGTMANGAVVAIHYHPAAAYAPFKNQDYYGSVYRNNANSFTVMLAYRKEIITGGKQGTEWSWDPLALKSEVVNRTAYSYDINATGSFNEAGFKALMAVVATKLTADGMCGVFSSSFNGTYGLSTFYRKGNYIFGDYQPTDYAYIFKILYNVSNTDVTVRKSGNYTAI